MIKLTQVPPPEYLTSEKIKLLTEKFKNKNSPVWADKKIKKALNLTSNGKCCYCECNLGTTANYLEVEHFKCKSKYPDEVLEWSNLLPACKRCNSIKNNHDVVLTPIINPYLDIPKQHLALKSRRLIGLDDLGKNTVEILELNDLQRLLRERSLLIDVIEDKISNLLELTTTTDFIIIRKIKTGIRGLLSESQPTCTFSAITSTFLTTSLDFLEIKNFLIVHEQWDQDLVDLYSICNAIGLTQIALYNQLKS